MSGGTSYWGWQAGERGKLRWQAPVAGFGQPRAEIEAAGTRLRLEKVRPSPGRLLYEVHDDGALPVDLVDLPGRILRGCLLVELLVNKRLLFWWANAANSAVAVPNGLVGKLLTLLTRP